MRLFSRASSAAFTSVIGAAFISSTPAAAPSSNGAPVAAPPLPVFTRDDVSMHGRSASRVWVTHGVGVYDVTDFIAQHPGGPKVLLAAGGALEPWWSLYAVQHNKPFVRDVLETYRIGTLHPADVSLPSAAVRVVDPEYADDASLARHPALITRSTAPFCAETPGELLVDAYVTPQALLFTRSHGPVPRIDGDSYRLTVEGIKGAGVSGKVFSLADLRAAGPSTRVVAALQCSGNRRSQMEPPSLGGLAWGSGAVGNIEWEGVLLRDVLRTAGAVEGTFSHIHFEGLDGDGAGGRGYAVSLPADVALDPRRPVLLATHANGEPLTPDHGAPVRVIVPGVNAARSVKWLGRVALADEESDGFFQRSDYRLFPSDLRAPLPNKSRDTLEGEPKPLPPLNDMPVTSAICEPTGGARVARGDSICVKGWAWSGGGRGIARVEVSSDGGATWVLAHALTHPPDASVSRVASWGWTLWEASIVVPSEAGLTCDVLARAVDVSGNVQPEKSLWNFRGLANNSWSRVRLNVLP